MPIRLNLLAEEQDLKRERLRDPQFIGYVVGGSICLLVTLYSMSVFWSGQQTAGKVSKLQTQWTQNEAKFKELEARRNDSVDKEAQIGSLQRYTTNRFLWAPVLDDLQFSLIPNIYLSSLNGEQTLEFIPKRQVGEATIPASVKESVRLFVKGFDTSPELNLSINNYSKQLIEGKTLGNYLTSDGQIQLNEVGSRRVDPIDPDITYVEFTLLCNLAEKEHK